METKSLQWKAISYGFLSFVLVWFIWAVLSNIIVGETNTPNEAIFYTTSVISGLLPGYIASAISKKYYLLHSVLTGISIALGILLFWALVGAFEQGSRYSLIATPVFLIVLSLLGGVIAKLQGKTA